MSKKQRKKQRAERNKPLVVERRVAHLSRAEVVDLLKALEACGEAASDLHRRLRGLLQEFDDAALRLRELEHAAKATAYWEDPLAWTNPLQRYLNKQQKGQIAKEAERIRKLIEKRQRRDERQQDRG